MLIHLPYDKSVIRLELPDQTTVLRSTYPRGIFSAEVLLMQAINKPIAAPSLAKVLQNRRPGKVVVVVSDVTRPIPYVQFLPRLLQELIAGGIAADDILLLIAAGMHRPSYEAERIEMFGQEIANSFAIVDHRAEADDLIELPQKSWAGAVVKLNRLLMEAGFRLLIGLVEPHFMAGFSGGRKAICPGLASLETIRQFHGYSFLANEHADIAQLEHNPCHLEALSVAKTVGIDFSINVVLNDERQTVAVFAGDLEQSHLDACEFVRRHANPLIEQVFDVVVTSSGGYPLDATFYQCVKSMVYALPAVKKDGSIISVGGCSEGIGSREYQDLMFRYAGDWQSFIRDISCSESVCKDQWQFQLHARALKKIGQEHLYFITHALPQEILLKLSVSGITTDQVQTTLQQQIDRAAAQGLSVCAIPEGPYCAPIGHAFQESEVRGQEIMNGPRINTYE
ncbi:MAG: nickel-dependent lactate racemase [Calditrichaeota bacterium]|nr:MAG: nickel-dependent lactate racemase [Calditrichota bacterium]